MVSGLWSAGGVARWSVDRASEQSGAGVSQWRWRRRRRCTRGSSSLRCALRCCHAHSQAGSAAARDREPSVGLGCKERFKNRRFQVPSDEELH